MGAQVGDLLLLFDELSLLAMRGQMGGSTFFRLEIGVSPSASSFPFFSLIDRFFSVVCVPNCTRQPPGVGFAYHPEDRE
jgi:hypothetical protein